MNDSEDSWQKLIRAAKPALDDDAPTPPPAPPVGRLKQAVQALVLTLTWRKWALVAALLAAGIAAAVSFLHRDDEPEPPLIEPEPPLSEELP